MVTVKCAWCGKDIQTYPSRIARYKERNSKFYCSKECKGSYWHEHRTGSNNPKSKPKVSVSCFHCSSKFEVERWRLKSTKRFFCSKECKGKWMSENYSGENNASYKKETHVKLTCPQCSKEFETSKTQHDRFKLNFCSKKCIDEYKTGKPNGRVYPKITCICPICEKEYAQSRDANRRKKTCSKECGYRLRAITRDKKVTLKCKHCGKSYKTHKCEEERSKYCSRSCLACDKIASTIHSSTVPEMIAKKALDLLKLENVHQHRIEQMTVDFYLPTMNIVLEVQGDYWHGNPAIYSYKGLDEIQRSNRIRDKKRRIVLKEKGFAVVYVWERDLKENPLGSIKAALKSPL
jgi:very-short-patch-repair endonuclease